MLSCKDVHLIHIFLQVLSTLISKNVVKQLWCLLGVWAGESAKWEKEGMCKVQRLRLLFLLLWASFGILLSLSSVYSSINLCCCWKELYYHSFPVPLYNTNTCTLLSEMNQTTGWKYTTRLFPFCQLLETKIVVAGKKLRKCIW